MGILATSTGQWFINIFNVIPKIVYFICVSIISIMDAFQLMLRKVAGLDSYYIGDSTEPVYGDIALSFIESIVDPNTPYPAIKNAFWSLMILASIMLVISTIIAVIRQEYEPGKQELKMREKPLNNKIYVVTRSIRAMFLFLIVPVAAILGLMMSNIFLQAIDRASTGTSTASPLFNNAQAAQVLQSREVNGVVSYSYYDIFLGGWPTSTTSFSGYMFKTSAFQANRVRRNQVFDEGTFYELVAANELSNFGIFNFAQSEEEMAIMIDDAFANNVQLSDSANKLLILGPMKGEMNTSVWGIQSNNYQVQSFSKFNIALVSYYYDLWFFNYILGFAFLVVGAQLYTNMIAGLMKRTIELVALFIISPPVIAVMPLDEGKTFYNWRKKFVGRAISASAVVISVNLIYIILPYLQDIKMLPPINNGYEFINMLFSTFFVVIGLQTVETFIALISKMTGAEDPAAAGGKLVQEVGTAVKRAAIMAGAAAGAVVAGGAIAGKVGGSLVKGLAKEGGQVAGQMGKFMDTKYNGGKIQSKLSKNKEKREERRQQRQENREKNGTLFQRMLTGDKKSQEEIEQTKEKAAKEFEGEVGDKAYKEMVEQSDEYNQIVDEMYENYKAKGGKDDRELYAKSGGVISSARKKYVQQTGMTKEKFKKDSKERDRYINSKVAQTRGRLASDRGQRVANAVVTNTGLRNLSTVGELFTEEMKDTFVRGGAKGGFPSMINSFKGATVYDSELFGIMKKQQKKESMNARIQMEVEKEMAEEAKKRKK